MDDKGSVFFELLERPDFKRGWQNRSYRKNEVIISEGDFSGEIYLLLKGTVRVSGRVLMGDDYHLKPGIRDLGRGAVFGEMSMLDQAPHSATAVAVTNCDLAVIDHSFLLSFMDEHPETGYAVYKALCLSLVERLRKTNKQLFSVLAWGLKVHGYEQYMK